MSIQSYTGYQFSLCVTIYVLTSSFKSISLGHGSSDRDAVGHIQRSFQDLEAAADLTAHLSFVLNEHVKTAKNHLKALSLRHGMSSLPDDILSEVLMYATRPDNLEKGMPVDVEIEMNSIRAALSLTHVCSRFRGLVLNNPRVWTILSDQFPNSNMILHCIKYAKSAPLDVFMEYFGFPHLGIKCRSS